MHTARSVRHTFQVQANRGWHCEARGIELRSSKTKQSGSEEEHGREHGCEKEAFSVVVQVKYSIRSTAKS